MFRPYYIAGVLFLISSVSASAADLSAFGGATPAMGHTVVSTATTKQTTSAATNSAVDMPIATASGKTSDTVTVGTSSSIDSANPKSVTASKPTKQDEAAAKAAAEKAKKDAAKTAAPTPAATTPAPVDGAAPAEGTYTDEQVQETQYIYKGAKNAEVPELMVKDPRIDDSYVQEMFGRDLNK